MVYELGAIELQRTLVKITFLGMLRPLRILYLHSKHAAEYDLLYLSVRFLYILGKENIWSLTAGE